MKGRGLKTQIFLSFVAVIIFLVLCIAVFRSYVIRTEIVARAQRQVKNDLKAARSIYSGELERIEKMFGLASASGQAPGALKKMMGLDYMYRVSAGDAGSVKSDIARKAFDGNAIGGTRIIGADELKEMGEDIRRKAEIDVVFTEKARPSDVKVLRSAMAMEYAVPLFDTAGAVTGLMFGGRILNRDFSLVDDMRDMVFENRLYGGKPVGTVTIFQDDIRIATNVLDKKGERAIGTRVSDTVYDTVLNRGLPWRDRAFVVTDWYLTAYEPIRDINGDVIGMLYVGTLERPFKDLERASIFGVAAIAGLAALLAAALS
ncbi:MAG: cache domain-containing protein, partial [Candidatus Omnitrophica bacterium]|nr:cache domain-containing protein [Candidatus Omnitrophota bacterium]